MPAISFKGKSTTVSEEDYDIVSKLCLDLTPNGYVRDTKSGKTLHVLLLGEPPKGFVVDHINRDKLDNTRENLRYATFSQNSQNKTSSKPYFGVTFDKSCQKWKAASSNKHIGLYSSIVEAAEAYDRYVLKVYGPKAKTNGIASFEQIKDIALEELSAQKKKRHLPEHINHYKSTDLYYAKIRYNKKVYQSPNCSSVEEALTYLNDFKLQIETIKRTSSKHNIIHYDNYCEFLIEDIHCIVDADLVQEIVKYSWYLNTRGYPQSRVDGSMTLLHRFVMELNGVDIYEPLIVDHINNNKLDNRFVNLRLNTRTGNSHNRSKKHSKNYIGVILDERSKKFEANIQKDGIKYYLGRYDSEEKAALAYDIKAIELYGEFANHNCISYTQSMYDMVQETMNDTKKSEKTSKYRGVYLKRNMWCAHIRHNKKSYSLGYYGNEKDAAVAYNKKALELYGDDYKYLNKV